MSVNFYFVGKRIKEEREKRSYTQAELSEKAEISAQYLSQVETAKKQVSLVALVRISNALGVNIDSLLRGNQVEDKQEYQSELYELMTDCSPFEKRVLYEQAKCTRRILRESISMLNPRES